MIFVCFLGIEIALFFFFYLGKIGKQGTRIKLMRGWMIDDNLILFERFSNNRI